MHFLRRPYKQKPKQWGPFSAVQSALFRNLEKLGFDPATIKLATPGWEGAGLIAHNYAKTLVSGDLEQGAVFKKGGMAFETGTDNLDTNLKILDLCRSDDDLASLGSTIFQFQQTIPVTEAYAYLISNTGNYTYYGIWYRLSDGQVSFYPGEQNFGVSVGPKIYDYKTHCVGISWEYNDYPRLLVDQTFFNATGLASSTEPYKNYYVNYGGRPDSAVRYSCGIMNSILATNVRWSDDELMLLSENINRVWQSYVPPLIFDLGAQSGILPITGNLSFTGLNLLANETYQIQKKDFTFTGKNLIASFVATINTLALSFTGRTLITNEAYIINKLTATFSGKNLFFSETFTIPLKALTFTGKTLTTITGTVVQLATLAFSFTGRILYANEIYIIIKKAFTFTGKNVTVLIGGVVSALKRGLNRLGLTDSLD